MDQTDFDRLLEFDLDCLELFSQSIDLPTSSVTDLENLLLDPEDKNCDYYAVKKEVEHLKAVTSDHDYSLAAGKSTDHEYSLAAGKSTDHGLKIQMNEDLSSDTSSNQLYENQDDWVNELLNPIPPKGANSSASTDTEEMFAVNIPAESTTVNDAGAATEDFSARSPDSTNPSVTAKSSCKRKASSSPSNVGSFGCNSKNAIAARENRLKKKKYVEDLENRNKQLQKENQLVLNQADEREERIRELERRNAYLENVLRNESTLSSLLGNLQPVSEVRLSIASQGVRKKQRRGHGTANEVIPMSNGVCLHVDGQTASIELCAHCAAMAKGGSP